MVQNGKQFGFHCLLQRNQVIDLMTRYGLSNRFEDLHRCRDSDIRRDQHFFKLVEKCLIDLLSVFKDRIELRVDGIPGLFDRFRKPYAEFLLDRRFALFELLNGLVEPEYRS